MLTYRKVECYAKGGRRFTVGPSLSTTGAVQERDCKVCGVSGEPESRAVREIGFTPLSKPLQNKVSNKYGETTCAQNDTVFLKLQLFSVKSAYSIMLSYFFVF